MNLLPFVLACALMMSCNKSVSPPPLPSNPKPVAGLVQFKIFSDPRMRQEQPLSKDAGIRLSIHQTKLENAMPVRIWDTLVPIRQLTSYPGPEDPLIIEKPIEMVQGKKIFYQLTAQKIYRVNQQIQVEELSRGIGSNQLEAILSIGL
ncbi:hypothetical protein [Flavihumibacter cheonanensis]